MRCVGLWVVALVAGTAVAQPVVPVGFSARLIAPLIDGIRPRLEAVSDPAYGFGVLSVSVRDQLLTVRQIDPSGTIRPIGTFSSPSGFEQPFVTIDQTGAYNGLLHVSYVDRFACPVITTVLTVTPEGQFDTRLVTDRASDWGFRLAFSDGHAGLPLGAVLHDGCFQAGNALATLDTSYSVQVQDPDSNPPGRTDMDIRELQQDASGNYGGASSSRIVIQITMISQQSTNSATFSLAGHTAGSPTPLVLHSGSTRIWRSQPLVPSAASSMSLRFCGMNSNRWHPMARTQPGRLGS